MSQQENILNPNPTRKATKDDLPSFNPKHTEMKKISYIRKNNVLLMTHEGESKSIELPDKAESIVIEHGGGSIHIIGKESEGFVFQGYEPVFVSATLSEVEFK